MGGRLVTVKAWNWLACVFTVLTGRFRLVTEALNLGYEADNRARHQKPRNFHHAKPIVSQMITLAIET